MRILQLIPELNEGGVERGVVDLNREFVKLGIDNIVISNGGRLVNEIINDGGNHIQFDICSKNVLTFIKRVIGLKKILKEVNPDIIHVRSRVPAWFLKFANKKLNIPVVSTVHGFNSINKYSEIMTKADKVICGSSFMIDHIIRHYNTPKDKIYLIPRGIDEKYFNSKDFDKKYIDELVDKYDLSDKKIITQVARITNWKDQETVIKAFKLLKEKKNNIKLILVGSYHLNRESYYSRLSKLVEDFSLQNEVIFLGHTDKIKEIFSISDINISASIKPETFGRANVEGMFLGVPLIGTNIGATSDYIIDGKTGFSFNPHDENELFKKIDLAFETIFDTQFIEDFAKTNFSLKSMVEKNIQIYNELLEKEDKN